MSFEVSVAGLTEAQAVFVRTYIQTGEVAASAREAGYAHESSGYAALRSPNVQKAITDHIDRVIKCEGASLAMRTMVDLMKPGNPGGVRFQAAKYVLDAAGHGQKPDGQREKPLSEMTETELSDFISKMDKVIEAGGSPPVIAVKPDPADSAQEMRVIDGVAVVKDSQEQEDGE